MPSLWGPPPPRALPGWGRAASKPPRRRGWSSRRRPSRPGSSHPLLPTRSTRQGGLRPRAGGTPPLGHPPGSEPPAGPAAARSGGRRSPRPQSLRLAATAPAAAAATVGRRGRRSGEEGRSGWEKRKKVLRLSAAAGSRRLGDGLARCCPARRQGFGAPGRYPLTASDASSLPDPLRGAPEAPPFRTSPRETQTRFPRRLE